MRTVFTAIVALWPLCVLGQGTVILSNPGGLPVYNALTRQPVVVGPAFQVALYYAPDGIIDEAQFFQLGRSVGFGPTPGYFGGGRRTAPTATPGGYGMFQVRAWEAAFGTTYEQAVANTTPQDGRLALAGSSGIMRLRTGGGYVGDTDAKLLDAVAVIGAHLRNGFTLNVVPEPSTFFLILVGAVGMLLFRRFR